MQREMFHLSGTDGEVKQYEIQERRMAKLYAISKALQHKAWSQSFIARMVLEAAVELSEAERGALVMFDKEGQPPTQTFLVNMDEAMSQAIEAFLIEQSLLTKLDQGHHVLRLRELTLQANRAGVPFDGLLTHAFCGTAIKAHDGLFGRLYLIKEQMLRREFTELDVQMIGTLAMHAGLSIHSAFLVNKVMTARSQHVALLESTSEGIYGVDLEGRCTFINKAAAALLGYQVDEVIGQPMHELIHHSRQDGSPYSRKTCSIYRVCRTGQACRIDNEVLWKKDGSAIPVEFSASPLYKNGHIQGAVVTFHDITRRKQADDALRTSEEHYRLLFENNRAPMYVYDMRTLAILAVNQSAVRHYGYSQSEFLGMRIVDVHPLDERSAMVAHLGESAHRWIEPEFQDTGAWRHCKKDGTTFPVEIAWSSIHFRDQQAGLIVVHDMTERRQAEETRLQLLDRAIIMQEEERGRIARELHDETQQALTSLLVGLRTMEEAPSVNDLRSCAQTLRGIAGQALDELQRLVQGLRPGVLDELGLEAALQRLRDEFVQVHRLRVELHVGNLTGMRPAPHVESALYRIAQEALTNAAKHACATTVSMFMQSTASRIRLVVEDDGCGFDLKDVRKTALSKGRLGLCGMEERAKIAGAILTIESARGRGTMIHVEVPVGTEL